MKLTLALYLMSATVAMAQACPAPNPNLSAPPFVSNCPLPAAALNRLAPLSGAVPFTAIQISPSVTWVGGPGFPNTALNLTETVTGTVGSYSLITGPGYVASLNAITIASDNVRAVAPAGHTSEVDGLTITHSFGGTSTIGSRAGLGVNLIQTAATGNAGQSPYNAFYPALFVNATANTNDGGGTGTEIGSLFGIGIQMGLGGGATHWQAFTGQEIDMVADTGSSVLNKLGIDLVLGSADAVQGSSFDAAVALDSIGTAAVGWVRGISFGGPNGWPFGSGSTLIGIPGNVAGHTVTDGVDLSNGAFSSAAFKSPGFVVDGSGRITGAGYKAGATAGVSCSGAPTSSFAATNGIVTHC